MIFAPNVVGIISNMFSTWFNQMGYHYLMSCACMIFFFLNVKYRKPKKKCNGCNTATGQVHWTNDLLLKSITYSSNKYIRIKNI